MTSRITSLLNINYPIILGGMSRITTSKLVAAVSEAGGLGVLTAVGLSGEGLRKEIQTTRQLTDKPFAVNLMLQEDNIPDLVKVICEEKVAAVTTGAGTPKYYMEDLKKAGVKVFPVIATVKHAIKMEALGVDGVIAEGMEAGGHIGQTTSLTLIPQIAQNVKIPVIAAGGIGSGQAILAAQALGAEGVQIGTRFLASEEAPIGENYKQKIIDANDTDTMITGIKSGAPVRVIKTSLTEKYSQLELAGGLADDLDSLVYGAYSNAVYHDDVENGSVLAGQVSGQIHDISSIEAIVQQLVSEYKETKEKLHQIDLL